MSADEERLAALVDELSRKPSYATGERRFPRPVSDEDDAAVAAALHAEADAGTAARARAAAAAGMRIACGPSCTACCEVVVMVYRPEAVAAARWLARPENSAARARFTVERARWRAALADAPARLAEASTGDPAAYAAAQESAWRRRVLCAFNHDGLCAIYPVRPLGCRNANALETNARCAPDSPSPPEAAAFAPLDQLLARAKLLLRATHNATGAPRHSQEPLCEAVGALLDEG